MTTDAQYSKEINPVYEWAGAKRRKLRGYLAQLADTDTLICSRELSTHHEAEVWLDERVYELLNDQPPVDPEYARQHCPTCNDEGDCPDCCPTVVGPDLATDLYNVVCLTLSGTGAATAISELRRVQKRYESEVKK